jgi:hypothetical protein
MLKPTSRLSTYFIKKIMVTQLRENSRSANYNLPHRLWQPKQKYKKERNPNAQPPTKTTWNSGCLARIRDIPSLLVKNNKTTDRTTRGKARRSLLEDSDAKNATVICPTRRSLPEDSDAKNATIVCPTRRSLPEDSNAKNATIICPTERLEAKQDEVSFVLLCKGQSKTRPSGRW